MSYFISSLSTVRIVDNFFHPHQVDLIHPHLLFLVDFNCNHFSSFYIVQQSISFHDTYQVYNKDTSERLFSVKDKHMRDKASETFEIELEDDLQPTFEVKGDFVRRNYKIIYRGSVVVAEVRFAWLGWWLPSVASAQLTTLTGILHEEKSHNIR